MEFLILVGLILLNGVFAMSEMAVIASKKVILQERANKGSKPAADALALINDPDRFLSTVQVGITLIGIGAGAFGGSAIAEDIADVVEAELPMFATHADQIGLGVIILITTYLSLVIGELVPKRIALSYSEQVAIFIAPTMLRLSRITTPVVWFLSKSTELIAYILGIQDTQTPVTDNEIIAMVQEGVHMGSLDSSEHLMVRGVLELDDISVKEIMTPRMDMIALNLEDDIQESLSKVVQEPLTVYPVYEGDIDDIIGVVYSEDILKQVLEKKIIDLKLLIREAIFVPETAPVATALKAFHDPSIKVVLVIDEHGGIEGLVSKNDIINEIIGYFEADDSRPIKRDDGSWLFDGSFPIDNIQQYIPEFEDTTEADAKYNTLAGFILNRMGRIGKAGDKLTWQSFSLEILDMDGKRIDKVLITPIQRQTAEDDRR